MKEYFVIHYGAGEDGGFGDYSNPTWSYNPLEHNGQVVWFDNEADAEFVSLELNKRSADVFYAHGEHSQWDGHFPMEYEVRRMFVPENPAAEKDSILEKICESNEENWKMEHEWVD